MSWVGMILPTPTAMVTTFILLSSEDNLRMKCLPVLSVNVYDPGLHRKLRSGVSARGKRRSQCPPGLLGICKLIADQHS